VENRNAALVARAEIREYGVEKFGWSNILKEEYLVGL
jgi:hypothetical protein